MPDKDDTIRYFKAIRRVKKEWPSSTNRYLHQVTYVEDSEHGVTRGAFSGWDAEKEDQIFQKKLRSNNSVISNETEEKIDSVKKNFATNANDRYDGKPLFPNHDIKHRRVVFIDMKIKRVSNVDTTEEHFRVNFHYYLTWLATWGEYLDWKKKTEGVPQTKQSNTKETYQRGNSWTPAWVPYVEYVNAIVVEHHKQIKPFQIKRGNHESFRLPEHFALSPVFAQTKDRIDHLPFTDGKHKISWDIMENEIGFKAIDGYWIRAQFEADVVFSEELELENFPFDCQDLSMIFKLSQNTFYTADLLPLPRVGEFLTLDSQFSVLTEWSLEGVLAEFNFTHPKHSKSLQSYPEMLIRIKAARVWKSHIMTFAITSCMFALGLGTFALSLEPGDLGNRLNYCVVFLLADVGTLQLVFEKLPKIQYTTLLEEYTFSCFFFLICTTIWSCIAGAFTSFGDYDTTAFLVFLGVFIVFQIVTVLRAYLARRWERKKLNKSTTELKKYIERNICCYMFCMRRNPSKIIISSWDHDKIFKKDLGSKISSELVVKGHVIPDEPDFLIDEDIAPENQSQSSGVHVAQNPPTNPQEIPAHLELAAHLDNPEKPNEKTI